MTFYLSFFVFILSLIAGLALMIAAKDMRRDKFLLLTAVHIIFLFGFIASLLLRKNDNADSYNYFFMTFICSGVILSGLAWRSFAPLFLKIYFSIFILTIPLFLFSPSMLLNFLLTMNYKETNGPVFKLEDKYFLEKQNNTQNGNGIPHYKIIVEHGIYHQTIQRDIIFGGKLDSIKMLDYQKGKSFQIRGYTSKSTYVSSEVDSTEVTIPLKVIKQGDVEYHL
jgi:hypothetical protein